MQNPVTDQRCDVGRGGHQHIVERHVEPSDKLIQFLFKILWIPVEERILHIGQHAAVADESVNSLAEDAKTEELLFVGTDLGIYVCTDATPAHVLPGDANDTPPNGVKWTSLCHTLPTCPVVDLAVHARDGALVAATHGQGIFLLGIDPIRAASRE